MKKSSKSEPKSQSVNPLTDTLQTVPGMPTKLKIYKVAISPYWWSRVYVDGRYRMKSLKTEKLKEAQDAAKKFFYQVLIDAQLGAIVFTILSAFATFERERIAARIREVKQLKKAQGKFTGGRRAFGYDVVDGVKVQREDEQAVIREMVKLREAGAGYRDIAEWMSKTQERKMTFMGVKRTLALAQLEAH